MEHEDNCPWSCGSDGDVFDPRTFPRPCDNKKCAVWKDLSTWFGYLGGNLSKLAFEEIFRDVAHDGSGVYERMSIEGGKMLRDIVEVQALKKCKGDLYINGVAKILFHNTDEHVLKLLRTLYVQNMANIMNNTTLLNYFAKSYLSAAQTLTTPRAVANYVRVCLAFSINENTGTSLHDKPKNWLPTLLQHIYHCQRFSHLKYEGDNVLLRNLHLYLGYKRMFRTELPSNSEYNILPRIKECFDNIDDLPQATEVGGHELLTKVATEYFCELYRSHNGDQEELALEYAKRECRNFFNSRAIELFACLHMKLHLIFINENINLLSYRSVYDTRLIFMNLIAACWSISQSQERDLWITNLFQILRQIQMLIAVHMSHMTKKLSHVNYSEIKNTNIVENKFELLLNPKCVKKTLDESVKEPKPYSFIQELLVDNTIKLFERSCLRTPENKKVVIHNPNGECAHDPLNRTILKKESDYTTCMEKALCFKVPTKK